MNLKEFVPTSKINENKWNSTDEDPLWLLTPEEFEVMPEGIHLSSINGEVRVKGADYIDLDTRFGMIAWGVRESQIA